MFDTLHVMKSLREAEFEEPQAEALVITFGTITQDLATKDDLRALGEKLGASIEKLEEKMATKDDIKDVYRHLWIMGVGLTAAFAAVSSAIQVMLGA